jgi:hypothetical protein
MLKKDNSQERILYKQGNKHGQHDNEYTLIKTDTAKHVRSNKGLISIKFAAVTSSNKRD